MDFGLVDLIILAVCGFAAGIINTVAGNGSAITLTAMIVMGVPATIANGTNRVGAFTQTLTSVLSLRKTNRTKLLFKESSWVFIPSFIGSIVGAFLAIDLDEILLKRIIGIIMLLLLASFLLNPKRWNIATDPNRSQKSTLGFIMFFFVGVYTGFIQMGVGILMLALLVLISKYAIKDANIIKLILGFVLATAPFLVFAFSSGIIWSAGIALAVGQALGAYIGARYVLYHPKAFVWTKSVLLAVLIYSVLEMFDLFALISPF
ncbi:MAG: sulfite exporter TauE/SafE family protein [Cryomorphaceae bacterium]|nr:sulfite exporter TauE/SafE family protein [Cryomorphaceae bacterium]